MPGYTPITIWDQAEDDKRVAASIQQDAMVQNYRAQAKSDGGVTANLLTQNAKAYPWLAGEVQKAAAQGGLPANDPRMQVLATSAVKTRKKAGFWDQDRGWWDVRNEFKGMVRGGLLATDLLFSPVKTGAQYAIFTLDTAARMLMGQPQKRITGAPKPVWNTGESYVALGDLIGGRPVDVGTGFIPRGEVAETALRAQRSLKVDGRAATLGRAMAMGFFDDKSTAYKVLSGIVDFSVAVGADPANKLGGEFAKLRAASKVIAPVEELQRAGGIIGGFQKAISPKTAMEYLTTGQGQRAVNWLAKQTDFNTIWRGTKETLPVETVLKLQKAGDPNAVRSVLQEVLGTDVREAPFGTFNTVGADIRNTVRVKLEPVSRLGEMMPTGSLPIGDVNKSVQQLDRFQRVLRLPEEVISRNNEALASATTQAQRLDISANLLADINSTLKGGGLGDEAVNGLTRMFREKIKELQHYDTNAIGEDVPLPWAVVNGEGVGTLSPQLSVEYMNKDIPLPDARQLARVMGATNRKIKAMNHVLNAGYNLSDYVLQPAMESIWKPSALLRGAWPLRVIGEEQIRMAMAGLDSLVKSPLSAIAIITGRKATGTLVDDANMLDTVTEFTEALSRKGMEYRNSMGKRITGEWTKYSKGQPGFTKAWADELAQVSQDPVSRSIAKVGPAQTLDEMLGGSLAPLRQQMINQGTKELADAEWTARYVNGVANRLDVKTMGFDDLKQAIQDRSWNGKALFDMNGGLNKDLMAELGKKVEQLPDNTVFKGALVRDERGMKGMYKNVVDYLFNALMSRPTNYLSRSSAFKQYYWQRVGELATGMDDATYAKAVARAADVKAGSLAQGLLDADKIRAGATVPKTLAYQDVDTLSKAFALESVKELLYSTEAKHRWADLTRNVIPFGEAWQEVLTRWAKMAVKNPVAPARNIMKGIKAGQESGTIFTDQYGEPRYVSPISFFSSKLGMQFTGTLKGLNMIGEGLPGVGPVVTIPMKYFVDQDNKFLNSILFPYGEKQPLAKDPLAILPQQWRKLLVAVQGPENSRELANLTMQVYEARVAGGLLPPPSDDTSMSKGLGEARNIARFMLLGQAMVNILPLSPGVVRSDMLLKNAEGKDIIPFGVEGIQAWKVGADYNKFIQQYGPKGALDQLLKKYGDLSYLFGQSQSYSKMWGSPPATEEALTWKEKNAAFAQKYPDVYGFFAPSTGKFSFAAYQKSQETGERVRLSTQEWARAANYKMGNTIYYGERAKMAAETDGAFSKEQQKYLSDLRKAIQKDYPGAFAAKTNQKRIGSAQAITKVFEAAAELKGNKAAEAVQLYQRERQSVIDELAAAKITLSSKKRAAAQRQYLANYGAALAKDNPEFTPVWEFLLSNEVGGGISGG